jgi:hypothetical protein
MITFCIICGSHSSVDEDSNPLVYYSELIGEMLLMFQISMLPTSKGKGVCTGQGNMMYSSTYSEYHYQRELGGRPYALAFLTLGTEPQHQLKMRLGASHNQSRHFGKRKVSYYCCEFYHDSSIIQPMTSSQQTMSTSSWSNVTQ